MQQPNGFWSAEPLSQEMPIRDDSMYATTAIVASALSTHTGYHKKVDVPPVDLQRHHRTVEQAARQLLSDHHEPLRSTALAMTDQICSSDKNFEITLLPRWFGQALKKPIPLTPRQYTALGVANVLVWIAYTIYDDFLDDEGIADQLPTANLTLRASFVCFQRALPGRTEMQEYITHTFNAMDEANAWEVNNCRFTIQAGTITISKLPHYRTGSVLAERSFAHALAPMLILLHGSLTQPQRRKVESALRHYLIARQLDDDLRDWQEDVMAGQASYVVTAILRDMRTAPGTHDLRTLQTAMQKCFRQTTMTRIARRILEHINASRRDFMKSQLMRPTNDIYALLDTIEVSVKHSLDKRSKGRALSAITTTSCVNSHANRAFHLPAQANMRLHIIR